MATLVFGLKEDSRLKKKLSNNKLTLEQTLLAIIADSTKYICWTFSKDARKGRAYKDKSILKALNGEYEKEKDELQSFETIEEFEEYMAQFNEV